MVQNKSKADKDTSKMNKNILPVNISKISKPNTKRLKSPSFDFDAVNFTQNQCMFGVSKYRKPAVQSYEQVFVLQPQSLCTSNGLGNSPTIRKKRKQGYCTESSQLVVPLQPTSTCMASSLCCSTSSTSSNDACSAHAPFPDVFFNANMMAQKGNEQKVRIHRSSISIRELLN